MSDRIGTFQNIEDMRERRTMLREELHTLNVESGGSWDVHQAIAVQMLGLKAQIDDLSNQILEAMS